MARSLVTNPGLACAECVACCELSSVPRKSLSRDLCPTSSCGRAPKDVVDTADAKTFAQESTFCLWVPAQLNTLMHSSNDVCFGQELVCDELPGSCVLHRSSIHVTCRHAPLVCRVCFCGAPGRLFLCAANVGSESSSSSCEAEPPCSMSGTFGFVTAGPLYPWTACCHDSSAAWAAFCASGGSLNHQERRGRRRWPI